MSAALVHSKQATSPIDAGIAEAGRMLRSGAVSSTELAHDCLDRIRRFDGRLNSFITVTDELALARAKRADAELRQGVDRGPFHGIPYALEDNVEWHRMRPKL